MCCVLRVACLVTRNTQHATHHPPASHDGNGISHWGNVNMVTTTSLQPAEEWIRALKRGFLARGRDFTKHPVINMMCDGQLTLDQLRLWACQQYVIVKP